MRLLALLRRKHLGDRLELGLNQLAPGPAMLAILLDRASQPLLDLVPLIRGQPELFGRNPELVREGIV